MDGHRFTVTEPDVSRWSARVRAEYTEVPGLHLTLAQARRLWNLDEPVIAAVLGALVDARFLRRTRTGGYARVE